MKGGCIKSPLLSSHPDLGEPLYYIADKQLDILKQFVLSPGICGSFEEVERDMYEPVRDYYKKCCLKD
ncbi:MAG TPA: hypothetical protein VMW32_07275 [Bacteroidales bacterium]|nr:hypothetical protein [Bacteroidales bacterium]